MKWLDKIERKWTLIRLQPIRVFCIHHVCDVYDESTMKRGDWLSTDEFKRIISVIRHNGGEFISLPDAYNMIKSNWFRKKKYFVLTADDGWESQKSIIPWLMEREIPITLFLNPAYLDGRHFRERETERYLSWEDVQQIGEKYPLVTFGSHGWEHTDATKLTMEEFLESVAQSDAYLKKLPNYNPFFAYAWGRHNDVTDRVLFMKKFVPVLIRGNKNYNDSSFVDRELLKS